MTRRDYELIADSILNARIGANDLYDSDKVIAMMVISEIAMTLANKMARDNPAFDKNLFLINCGVTS